MRGRTSIHVPICIGRVLKRHGIKSLRQQSFVTSWIQSRNLILINLKSLLFGKKKYNDIFQQQRLKGLNQTGIQELVKDNLEKFYNHTSFHSSWRNISLVSPTKNYIIATNISLCYNVTMNSFLAFLVGIGTLYLQSHVNLLYIRWTNDANLSVINK